jgi:hypothetical protein
MAIRQFKYIPEDYAGSSASAVTVLALLRSVRGNRLANARNPDLGRLHQVAIASDAPMAMAQTPRMKHQPNGVRSGPRFPWQNRSVSGRFSNWDVFTRGRD